MADVKGLTVEIGAETKGLEAALKDVGKRTSDVNKELGQVERALKFDPSNTVLLGQKQELLADKIAATRDKLDALRQAQERVDRMYSAGEIDDGQYRAFQRDVETTQNKLQTFEGQLRDVQTEQKQTGTSAKNMGDDVNKAADNAHAGGEKLKTVFKNIGKAAALAAAAVGAAMLATAKEVIDNADELQRLSDATGLSAERLGELQYVGNNLGVDLETISGAQAKLTKSMNAARDGAGSQAEAFAALGIAVTDGNGNLRDAKDVMNEAFQALNGVGNETERDAIAMQIFGRSAQDLNPLIVAGADELARLSQEARDNGAVMSNEAVAGLDTFGDTIENLKNTVLGKFGEAFADLLPKIQPFIDMLTGADGAAKITDFIPPEILAQILNLKVAIDDFSANTAPKIAAWFSEFIGPTVSDIGTAFRDMAMEIIPTITAIVQFVSDNWPAIQAVIEPVLTFIVANIKAAFQIIAGVVRTVTAVIRGDWDAALAGVKTILEGFVSYMRGSAIGQVIEAEFGKVREVAGWFEDMKNRVIGVLRDLLDKIKKPLGDIRQAIKDALDPFQRHSPSLVDRVRAGVEEIKSAYQSVGPLTIAGPQLAYASAAASPSFASGGSSAGAAAAGTSPAASSMTVNFNVPVPSYSEVVQAERDLVKGLYR